MGGGNIMDDAVMDCAARTNKKERETQGKGGAADNFSLRPEHAEMLLKTIPNGVFTIDTNNIVTSWNKRAEQITGYTAAEVVGKPCRLFAFEPCRKICSLFSDEITKPIIGKIAVIETKQGELRHICKNADLIRDEQGRVIGGIECFDDITDRIRMEAELKEARQQAETANRLKSRFIANMSHEIRTPLNGLKGFIELLGQSSLTEEQRHYVDGACSAADVLLYLINNILDFSKIEAGKMVIEQISFELRTTIEKIVVMLLPNALEKGLELNLHIHSNVPENVIGDPARLGQVLYNLIGNGIKFTEVGEVFVDVTKVAEDGKNQTIRFTVRDTGIGIAATDLQRLFQPFEQVDPSTTRKYGGTGLGLAISHELVKLMNGKIGVESQPGVGTEFFFEIPLPVEAMATKASPNELQRIGAVVIHPREEQRNILLDYLGEAGLSVTGLENGEKAIAWLIAHVKPNTDWVVFMDWQMTGMTMEQFVATLKALPMMKRVKLVLVTPVVKAKVKGIDGYLLKPIRRNDLQKLLFSVTSSGSSQSSETTLETMKPLTGVDLSSMKVLLVEDNEVNCKILTKMLLSKGISCDIALNGREAVRASQDKAYDLIFMDCQMPVMDGYESTAEIRRLEAGRRHTPIVAMTAHAMEGDREKCLKAGMDDYLSKPIDFEAMFALIEAYALKKQTSSAESQVAEAKEVFRKDSGFDEDMVEELFSDFFRLFPDWIQQVAVALEEQQTETVRNLAHKMKGSAGNLRLSQLSQWGALMEKAASAENLTDCHRYFVEIKAWAANILENKNPG